MVRGVGINRALVLLLTSGLFLATTSGSAQASPYIRFNPALPSTVCDKEKINISYEGEANVLLSYANQVSCAWDGYFDVWFYVRLMEADVWPNPDDEIDSQSRWGRTYDCATVNLAWPNYPSIGTFENVDLSAQAGGLEGSTVEVYPKADSGSDTAGIYPVSSSSVNVDVLYNCQCLPADGPCCTTASRPYQFKSSNSQPNGYSDYNYCSGTPSPFGGDSIYKKDYYCNGADALLHSTNTKVSDCGVCSYCSATYGQCLYYYNNEKCGTQNCDYLDTACRDYNDVDKVCTGGGTCQSLASCSSSYTNKPAHTSCGTGKECDGSGNCITCTSHSSSGCYDNDIYWYDACGNLQEKKSECGNDYCYSYWETYYCNGNELRRWRWCYSKGCSDGMCYNNPWKDDQSVQTCQYGCIPDAGQGARCKDICYNDSDCGSIGRYAPHCGAGGNVYMNYTVPVCKNPGQLSSYCEYHEEERLVENCQYGCSGGQCLGPGCTDDCSTGQTRCSGNSLQNCGNYDGDYCLEWPYSTSGAGNDDCSDCSCTCSGYNTPEVNELCSDGKDNDCDGLTDSDDPGCGGIQLDKQWEKSIGESGKEEQGNSLVRVYGNGYMVVGYQKSGGSSDSYLAKEYYDGSFLYWDKNMGHDDANSIKNVDSTNSMICGSTRDYYADGGLGGSNVYLYLANYNGDGYLFGTYGTRTAANPNTDEFGYDFVKTSGNSYVIAGGTTATGVLGKTAVFVVWVDYQGVQTWAKQFQIKDGNNAAYSIIRDGNYFVMTGGATDYLNTQSYIYILSIDFQGNKYWSEIYGTGVGNSIELTPDGYYLVAGSKDGNVYLLKALSNGIKVWDRILDSGEGNSVKIDSGGNYIVLATKDNDIELIKVTPSGDVLWKKAFTTSSTEKGRALLIDGEQFVVTGQKDRDLYLMKTTAPCIADCTAGKTRCSGNYKQSCGNYDADACLEWPSSTGGSGNENCGTSAYCSGVACTSCAAGTANCNQNPSDGCETNLLMNNSNCGYCGNICGSGKVCYNGNCMSDPLCPVGWTPCPLPRPDACIDLYKPACGDRGAGYTPKYATYSNSCYACADQNVICYKDGLCVSGDSDWNNRIDIFDLARVGICYWQSVSGSCQKADINNDGKIDIFDLATVGINYGKAC